MKIDIPDDVVRRAEINLTDLRVAVALQLYVDNRIDHADAVRIAELTPAAFNHELAARGLSIQEYSGRLLPLIRRDAG